MSATRVFPSCSTLLLALGCAIGAAPAWAGDDNHKKGSPSLVEKINGSKLHKITLTQKAADRLGVKTGVMTLASGGGLAAPYAALVYDIYGDAWVYTNPSPLVYQREKVDVASISGGLASLKSGPAAGTTVVVVGAAELYGAESGVGH